MSVRLLTRPLYLCLCDVITSVRNILFDGCSEQDRFLAHHSDLLS